MIGNIKSGLYRSKKDVDRLIEEHLKKVPNVHEKKQNGLSFARMYYKVCEFELAKQYVMTYLSVNENSPEGHRLLGQCYVKLGKKEKAFSEFQKSLTISPNQPELLLSCCELLIDSSIKFDDIQATTICEQVEALYPYHPSVSKLRERLVTSNNSYDASKVGNSLTVETITRPDDVNFRIKQLKLFESTNRLLEAFNYVINIEKTSNFQKNNIDWYIIASQICESFENSNQVQWEFYLTVLPIYDRLVSLKIADLKNKCNEISECYKYLYRLDQALYKAIQMPSIQTEFYRSLIHHISNQMYFNLACLIMKTAKNDNSVSWQKTNRLAAPFFLMSLAPTVNKQAFDNMSKKEFSEQQRSNVSLWESEGTRRIIESGFVLRSMIANEDEHFIDNIKILYSEGNEWKINTYKRIFIDIGSSLVVSSSFFIQYSTEKLVYSIPELIQYAVPKHMLSFESSRPGSLHHLVWYGLQLLENDSKNTGLRLNKDTVFPIGFRSKGFKNLPLTANSFASVNIESVCQIDLNTFLYATVFSVASILDCKSSKSDFKYQQICPSDITESLTSIEQDTWWRSLYKIYTKDVDIKNTSKLKNTVSQGLGAIRLIGDHGIDVQLMVHLAKNFAYQANKVVDDLLLKDGLEKRAILYWKMAVQLLERIVYNGTEHQPKHTLFEFSRKKLTSLEIADLLEEGKFYLACNMMNNDQYEKAIEAFKKLNSPYASFYQAMIYKKMAKHDVNTYNANTISSSVLLSKVKDLLNLTKERLKNNPQHPLNFQVKDEILELQLETDLNGTVNSRKEMNFDSGEEYVDTMNISSRKNQHKFNDKSYHNTTSTPVKSPHNSLIMHSTNSRKLEDDNLVMKELNELKIAVQSQNVQCQTMGLQYYNLTETMRTLSQKVDKIIDQLNNIKESIVKFDNLSNNLPMKITPDTKIIDRISKFEDHLNEKINTLSDIIQIKQDDDLYNIYQDNNTFEESPLNQLPLTNSDNYEVYSQANSQTNKSFSLCSNPNVNITSSDTLPVGPPVSQPQLSVIIPTHHILSGINRTIDSHSNLPINYNNQLLGNQPESATFHNLKPSNWLSKSSEKPSVFQTSLSTFKESLDISLNKSKNTDTDDSHTEEHDPIPEFLPIIPLPNKAEEFTGEENDIVLFERRAKLYKYTEKEWKEKGVGVLKILRNKDTAKVRLVMRREQVLKVCANHFLYDNMELKPKNDKAVLWTANDYSDTTQMQIENLCARFKSAEDCKDFIKVFNETKQPCSQNSSLVENSLTNNKQNIFDENKKNSQGLSGLSLSLENENSLKHTLGGFTFSAPPIVNEVVEPKQIEKTPEKSKGLFSSLKFSTPVINTQETPTLTSILTKPLFSMTESQINSTEEKKTVFNSPINESLNRSTANDNSSFNFSKTDDNKLLNFTPKLDLTSGLSATSYFSTLAKSSPSVGFNNSSDFKGFPGAGSTVFNIKTNPSPHAIIKSNISSNDLPNTPTEESEDFVPTAEFTPVIPLPDKVDIVTGEEGLNVVFEDRAKLLRFDSTSKEWKEKGIGQMKILHNSKKGYYQLLMRREIIFKICCNQRLTADLELKPVLSSDKAVSWIGQDFSEGENKRELYAIRFKTVQQLNQFKNKVNELKENIKDCAPVSIKPENNSNELLGISNKSDIQQNINLPKLNDLAQFKPKPGSWTCQGCYLSHESSVLKCPACNTTKPGVIIDNTTEIKSSNTGFSFGQSSFSSMFKFGMPQSQSENAQAISTFAPKLNTSELSFGSLSVNCNASNNTSQHIDQFKPLTWREESAGLVKYDSDKSDNSNEEESDNESDEYNKPQSTIKFESSNHKFPNVKLESPLLNVDILPKHLETSVNTYQNLDNDDGVKLLEVQNLKDIISLEDQVMAEKTKLPLYFFLYKVKPKCKGCIGCDDNQDKEEYKPEITCSETFCEKETGNINAKEDTLSTISDLSDSLITTTNNISPTSFLFGDKTSNALKNISTNLTIFGSNPIFGNTRTNYGNSSNDKSNNIFGVSPTTTQTNSLFNLPSTTKPQFFKSDYKKSENIFSFAPKCESSFKFGTLEKNSKPTIDPCNGKTNQNITAEDEKEENGEEEVDNSHDPQFEPIIPLPEAVVVSTGEENETVLFCERAKLFRKDGNEYKERGIGEMKILHHPNRKTYRLLFRREKVFKVVCNHLISSEITLVPMKSSNKALCWGCMNTTEDNPKAQKELLAVRFKNEESAQHFKQVYDDCVSKISNNQ
ncbi:E3 SUMO-protein ligase RanBP2-like isoform X2 [Daktulosphaira vitifoliae]|uniref:E3 SUMO-protein ligase RanBP2-like isoform X2 n=1 Tax=Daktulosphaira vitifoliae TaxID=58002 RepID=UPI0021AA2F78|nr:E3 SUMO-protein ligase RanBP2-like isoform X2 [Daktulosphaira vitifoliae]